MTDESCKTPLECECEDRCGTNWKPLEISPPGKCDAIFQCLALSPVDMLHPATADTRTMVEAWATMQLA